MTPQDLLAELDERVASLKQDIAHAHEAWLRVVRVAEQSGVLLHATGNDSPSVHIGGARAELACIETMSALLRSELKATGKEAA